MRTANLKLRECRQTPRGVTEAKLSSSAITTSRSLSSDASSFRLPEPVGDAIPWPKIDEKHLSLTFVSLV